MLQGSKEPPAGESGLSVCREAPQGEQGSDNPELEGSVEMMEVDWGLYAFLMQRIFFAIQIGNATSVIASLPVTATTSISFEL